MDGFNWSTLKEAIFERVYYCLYQKIEIVLNKQTQTSARLTTTLSWSWQ
jgi:hypothetical protein